MKDESFHAVFQANYRLIFHAVLLRTNNRELAEDICQQTFLKYLEYREVVKKGAERGWLLAVAKNLLTDDFRKKKLRLIDHTQIEESETEYCYEVDMAKEVSRKDFLRQILTELEEKNQDWYDAVYEVCMLNLPMADVAAQKNISIDLLRARLCRGRQFLKQRFGEEYQELK